MLQNVPPKTIQPCAESDPNVFNARSIHILRIDATLNTSWSSKLAREQQRAALAL